jgi:rsbT co-antagonist protein RsbR
MANRPQTEAETTLAADMRLDERAMELRRHAVSLGPDDDARIARIRPLVEQNLEELTNVFFSHLSQLDEAREFFRHRELVEQARALKREHLAAMVRGPYALDYAHQRLRLALIYSRVGLELRAFLGAFHHLMRAVGVSTMKDGRSTAEAFEDFMSLKKVAFFDIGIIVDAMIVQRERVIQRQQEAIRELSTPVLQIRDRLLMLPIIGTIDTHRARMLTEGLLHAIRANRARVVVMDVTGVAAVDTKVADHLIHTVLASKLMGANVIVTGLSAEVAQTLVALGVDLSRLNTMGDLQGGIEEAERLLGYRVVKSDPRTTAVATAP